MPNTRQIILKLKEVREERNLSYDRIVAMLEANGDYLSKSSVSRVFKDGSEEKSFNYNTTIRPIAKALLDMETIEESDTPEEQAIKIIMKAKIDRILELEEMVRELKEQLAHEKLRYHEKLEAERAKFDAILTFRSDQIVKKDERIDNLIEMLKKQMDRCEACQFTKTGVIE